MSRALSGAFRQAMERQETEEIPLVFLEIYHATLSVPIRVVNDSATYRGVNKTYIWRGEEWTAFPFELEYISDNEEFPTAKLAIQNVDRRIGLTIQVLRDRPRVSIYVVAASAFDLTANPRTAVDEVDPEPEAEALYLYLRDVSVDPMSVSGTLVSIGDLLDMWPAMMATKNRCPALYR